MTLLTIGALSCVQEVNQLAAPQLRLKTTNNVRYGGTPGSTEYVYDPTGRVASFTTSQGTKGVFAYDEQNRYKWLNYLYKPGDEKNGETHQYTYTTDGFTIKVSKLVDGNITTEISTKVYKVDGQGHLVSIATSSPWGSELETFEYTGNNITRQQFASGSEVRFEHDDKTNPYFGLMAPDIGVTRRFSRNNVVKLTTNGRTPAEVSFTYNADGFPVKLTEINGSGEVYYTYESVVTP